MEKINFSNGGDWANFDIGHLRFYFGYEYTYCKKHGNDKDCDCEEKEECFIVYNKKNNKELMRLPESKIIPKPVTDNVFDYMLIGLGIFFQTKYHL